MLLSNITYIILLLYCNVLLCNLAQEFPSGLIKFYLILSYLIYNFTSGSYKTVHQNVLLKVVCVLSFLHYYTSTLLYTIYYYNILYYTTALKLIVYKPDLCAPMSPRFLFVLLGPRGKARSYTQIGRAIATLMVDDVSLTSNPTVFVRP